jgi:hypothetical protein
MLMIYADDKRMMVSQNDIVHIPKNNQSSNGKWVIALNTVVFSLVLLITGCTNGESYKTSSAIIGNGWASPPDPFAPPELYCYRTLGSVDCHKHPLKDGESRLQGYYPPPFSSDASEPGKTITAHTFMNNSAFISSEIFPQEEIETCSPPQEEPIPLQK